VALGALRARIGRWAREDGEAAELVDTIVAPVTVAAARPVARTPIAVPAACACAGSL
jgi:hypothetical protein